MAQVDRGWLLDLSYTLLVSMQHASLLSWAVMVQVHGGVPLVRGVVRRDAKHPCKVILRVQLPTSPPFFL